MEAWKFRGGVVLEDPTLRSLKLGYNNLGSNHQIFLHV